jgi:hypothetical protein
MDTEFKLASMKLEQKSSNISAGLATSTIDDKLEKKLNLFTVLAKIIMLKMLVRERGWNKKNFLDKY